MISGEYIAIGALGVSIMGLAYKVSIDDKAKIGRVYTRLDEVKKNNDEKFVSKEVCGILHTQLREDIAELKFDVKLLLKQTKPI